MLPFGFLKHVAHLWRLYHSIQDLQAFSLLKQLLPHQLALLFALSTLGDQWLDDVVLLLTEFALRAAKLALSFLDFLCKSGDFPSGPSMLLDVISLQLGVLLDDLTRVSATLHDLEVPAHSPKLLVLLSDLFLQFHDFSLESGQILLL